MTVAIPITITTITTITTIIVMITMMIPCYVWYGQLSHH